MQIKLNGEQQEMEAGITVSGLLEQLQLQQNRVAVELNLEILPKARYADQVIQDGDRIEIVHFVGGG